MRRPFYHVCQLTFLAAAIVFRTAVEVAPANIGPTEAAEKSLQTNKEGAIDFRRDVYPILQQHCIRCHQGVAAKANLQMMNRASLIAGGDSGPAIIPGNGNESLLIDLVTSADPERVMPAKGERLAAAQVQMLRSWIDQGANWDVEKEYDLALKQVTLPAGDGNPIDRLLAPYFEQHGMKSRDLVNDERFARRVAFDLVGLPLDNQQLSDFLADLRPTKRGELARRLVEDQANYAGHWMTFWSDHLRIGSAVATGIFDNDETKGPRNWLKVELERDVPIDHFVQDLVAGDFFEQYAKSVAPAGEVASHVDVPEMQVATTISQVFLGLQLKCASCHDSFVDRWKMQDAWGLASALADEPFDIYRCEIAMGRKAVPRFPLTGLGAIDAGADKQVRRRQVANLITTSQNGLFARTIVNRLWARLFGRGLVEPLDEMMEHDPWNADLLDWLAGELIRQKYDLKKLLVLITSSRAYQSPAVVRQHPVEAKDYVFNGPEVRHLSAEQFVDCVSMLQACSTALSIHLVKWSALCNFVLQIKRSIAVCRQS